MSDPSQAYGATVAGAPGARISTYPTGGRRRTWREPRLRDDQEHPVVTSRLHDDEEQWVGTARWLRCRRCGRREDLT